MASTETTKGWLGHPRGKAAYACKRKGQTVAEFALATLAMAPIGFALALYSFGLLAVSGLKVEAYSKARALLYGQQPRCRPSSDLLPSFSFSHLQYFCETDGTVRAELQINGKAFYNYKINLLAQSKGLPL